MNFRELLKKAVEKGERYKYVLLVLLIGLGLMLWSPGETEGEPADIEVQDTGEAMAERLEEILRTIDGAGEVRVELTLTDSGKKELATDINGDRTEAVIVQTGSGATEPVIESTTYPNYRGALVVCTGGDDPEVRLKLSQAVAALTGLGTDKIRVEKMQSY